MLFLHYTGASGLALLTENFMNALYAPGQPLDASKYFIIIPDNIGHGQSSKPSDGLRMQFPRYGYLDMVDLQYKLITEKLGIKHLKMILGTSMGGMHTWLWTEQHPTVMDGAMPIVSLPAAVTGRNLLWRQMIVQAIKNDPQWQNGNYAGQLPGFLSAWPFARMLLDGVPHLHHTITDREQALQFINEASEEAAKKEVIDILYVLDASADYNPEPGLNAIQAKVFALDFTDDQLDPVELNALKKLIKQVKNGRAIIQDGNASTFGHLTMAHPELWKDQVKTFVSWVEGSANVVDIGGGRTMYLECQGAGQPSVVFISGRADRANIWQNEDSQPSVYEALAKLTQVCAYDRPGTVTTNGSSIEASRSSAVPQPHALKEAVADLHALLTTAKVPQPFVLVGHSYGGLIARLYASIYPGEVAGLVLIDTLTELMYDKFTPAQQQMWRRLNSNYSPDLDPYMQEKTDFITDFEQMRTAPPVRAIPAIILTSDEPYDFKALIASGILPADAPLDFGSVVFQNHLAGQKRLAQLLNAKHITQTHAGHYIQTEQPQLVIKAIQDVIDQVRSNAVQKTR